MSVESLSEESIGRAGNADEEETEDRDEYLDPQRMFWDLMSFEHIHNNNALIDHEVQRERDAHMEWFLEELQMANEVDSTLWSSSSPEDTCQCFDHSPLNHHEHFTDSSSSSSSHARSSSQDSEGSGTLESTNKSGETSDSS